MVFSGSIQNIETSFEDKFESDNLDLKWNFRRYPIEKIFYLDKQQNRLNLICHHNQIKERVSAALLGFKQTESNFEYSTQMFFEPLNNGSEAGISIFQKDDNYINFTLIRNDDKIVLQSYAVQNTEIEEFLSEPIKEYNGQIEFRIVANEDSYKLYYKTSSKDFELFTILNGDLVISKGYTGAHLGLYATGNGKNTKDFASFDYVNYFTKKK